MCVELRQTVVELPMWQDCVERSERESYWSWCCQASNFVRQSSMDF